MRIFLFCSLLTSTAAQSMLWSIGKSETPDTRGISQLYYNINGLTSPFSSSNLCRGEGPSASKTIFPVSDKLTLRLAFKDNMDMTNLKCFVTLESPSQPTITLSKDESCMSLTEIVGKDTISGLSFLDWTFDITNKDKIQCPDDNCFLRWKMVNQNQNYENCIDVKFDGNKKSMRSVSHGDIVSENKLRRRTFNHFGMLIQI